MRFHPTRALASCIAFGIVAVAIQCMSHLVNVTTFQDRLQETFGKPWAFKNA